MGDIVALHLALARRQLLQRGAWMRVGCIWTQNIVFWTVTVQNMLRAVTCLLVDQELALLSLNLLLNLLCTLVILLIVGIHTLEL